MKVGVRNAHRPNANNELGDMTPGEEALMRSCKSGHCGQACLERAHRHFTPGRAPPVPQGGRLGVTVLPHSARLRPSWLPPAPVCVAGGRVFPGKVCRSAHSSLFCTPPSSLHPACPARTHNRLAHAVPFLHEDRMLLRMAHSTEACFPRRTPPPANAGPEAEGGRRTLSEETLS